MKNNEVAACDELALDRYQGYPTLYTKEVVTIATVDGEQTAMLYVMAKQYEDVPAMQNELILRLLGRGTEIME